MREEKSRKSRERATSSSGGSYFSTWRPVCLYFHSYLIHDHTNFFPNKSTNKIVNNHFYIFRLENLHNLTYFKLLNSCNKFRRKFYSIHLVEKSKGSRQWILKWWTNSIYRLSIHREKNRWRKIHKTGIIHWRDVYTRFVDRKNAFAYERDSGKSELPSLDFRGINNDRFDSWTPVVIPSNSLEFPQPLWLLDPPRNLYTCRRVSIKCCPLSIRQQFHQGCLSVIEFLLYTLFHFSSISMFDLLSLLYSFLSFKFTIPVGRRLSIL